MSFLTSLLEFKNRLTFKQLTVLVICLMFLQYNCADGSAEDDEEEEDEAVVTKPEDYTDNPSKVETFDQLPQKYKDNTTVIPPKQFSIVDFSKPTRNSKNKIGFKARNLLYGNYSHLPAINIWIVLMTMLLNLSPKKRRERRRLEEANVDCRNSENIPNKEISSSSSTLIDFTCESKEDAPSNLESSEIKVAEIGGEPAPEYITNQDLSSKANDLSNPDLESYTIQYIEEISSDSVTLTGTGYDIKNLGGTFSAQLIQSNKTVGEAKCNFNENNAVVCNYNNIKNIVSNGIQFDEILTINNGEVSNRRLQTPNTQYLKVGTDGTPIRQNATDSILKGSKDSSGLSGGAIAGIVIACAAVLIGAILAALLCRKTTTSTTLYTTGTQDNLAIEQKPVYY